MYILYSKWPQWQDLSNKPSMNIVIAILLLQSTKNRFSAVIRENVDRRHCFGIRGPTSKYYYGKAIWDRNLIFVAIFLILNILKRMEAFRIYVIWNWQTILGMRWTCSNKISQRLYLNYIIISRMIYYAETYILLDICLAHGITLIQSIFYPVFW